MNLIHEDVDRFWEIWPRLSPTDLDACARILEDEYLGPGSVGLQDFWRLRIESGRQFAGAIHARPRYYAALEGVCAKLRTQEDLIQDACSRLSVLAGSASPQVDTYFLIGRMSAAGTVSENGLLIGLDMMGRSDSTPLDELGDWHRSVVAPLENLPRLVLHEFVHALQHTAPLNTLLANAIVEGTADFLVTILLGPSQADLYEFGRAHESDLWAEFKRTMHDVDFSNWLCQGDCAKDRPADLGYFVGHQICASYFARQPDPVVAVRDMLTIESFEEFVTASGYDGEATEVPCTVRVVPNM